MVLAGIGNPIRMDDFVGIKIIKDLQGKVTGDIYLIECETVPENFIQQIIDFKPSHVLLIDAAILGLKPGNTRLINPDQLTILPVCSTHMLPMRVFCDCLAKTTDAKISLLLIEPEATGFGEGLTPKIEGAAHEIASVLLSFL